MNGKLVASAIVLTAAVAGMGGYWLQEYAFYAPVIFTPGQEVLLTALTTATPQPIAVSDAQGIDATSSPLRYRACFTAKDPLPSLSATYTPYPSATPLNAPSWFSCFDAGAITSALVDGKAVAFLGQTNILPNSGNVQIDRVIAVFPDGQAFAWNQLAPGVEP